MSEIMMTGATGGIGQAVAAALAATGHRLTVVGRDAGRLHIPGLRAITADLPQPQNLAQRQPSAAPRSFSQSTRIWRCVSTEPAAPSAVCCPA